MTWPSAASGPRLSEKSVAAILTKMQSHEANEAVDAERFWSEVAAARAWRDSLSEEDRDRIAERDAEVDASFDGIG